VASLPHSHILQSWEWGDFKSRYNWRAQRLVWEGGRAAAQVLTRSALRGLVNVMYLPKGPLLIWDDHELRARVLADLEALARAQRAILIKIDPDAPAGADLQDALKQRGWRFSPDQVQFRNTAILNLDQPEDALLAAMKQKTRYNIRLAARKGVRVRPGTLDDLDRLYRLYAETSLRDGFVIRHADYYRDAWGSFIRTGLAQPFIAEAEGEPVGGLILFHFARTAWYFYGMSRDQHRDRMPNHLLQWEAMRWAKARGCSVYDFWGAPDELNEADAMWGVWKFKEGFGGQFVQHLGAWDYAPAPLLYPLYTQLLPRALEVMRRRGRQQTQRSLEG
jgi:lipid II:glycine glycyltransferase (peptidoglycan interpeptide bridge formation enzyme)